MKVRVAHPGVAVVPVPLAAGRLGQRRRERRHGGPGRHVGEALDGQGRALDRVAPAVVGHPRPSQPRAPEPRRWRPAGRSPRDVGRRRQSLGPRQGAVALLAGRQHVPGPDPVALHPEREVGLQPDGLARAGRVGGMPAALDQRPFGRRPAVVERRLAHEIDLDGALQAADRAHQEVIGVVVGGRPGVRRDLVLGLPWTHRQRVADQDPARRRLPRRREDVRAGLVDPRGRVVDPEGPEPEVARLTVEQGAEHAGRVEAGDAQPVDRAVGRDQGAGVAVGQERVVGDGRERGGCRRALGGLVVHDATHGLCQPPYSAVSPSASAGPQEPGGYAWTGGGASSNGCMTRQVSSTPSCRVKRVLSPTQSSVQEHLVRRGPLTALLGELHVQVDPPDRRDVGAPCVQDHPDPGRRVQLDDDLVGFGVRPHDPEAQRRGTLEDESQLGLGHGEPLAGPDEERDTRPSPVLDVEPHRGVGLRGRVRCHAVDAEIPVVLSPHVVSRVGLDDRVEQGHLGILDRLSGHRATAPPSPPPTTTCIRWLTTTSRIAPTGS